MSKRQIRDQIAEAYGFEDIKDLLERAKTATTYDNVICPGCKRTNKFQVFDNKFALEVAKFAVEQGYGKAPTAKPVAEVDFSRSDPFQMGSEERGQLLEKVLGAIEGKASPPPSWGTPGS